MIARLRSVHYAWVVAAVTFLTLLAAAGFRSTIGVFVVPLQDEFGWGRDQVSVAISINLLCYRLVAPFAAAVVERLGTRRVMAGALVAIAAGSALTVLITTLWQLDLLWGVVIGLSTGSIAIPLSAIVATRWFVRHRGLVTGLMAASFATGNLIFLPMLAWITEAQGWRRCRRPSRSPTNTVFGRERAGVVFGWIFAAHMLGGAAAVYVAGAARTTFGNYVITFVGGGLLAILAGFASLTIARDSSRTVPPAVPELA